MNLKDFEPGDRVQLHPATDAWMSGDRFGAVVRAGRKFLRLRMDSGKARQVSPCDILEIVSRG